MTTFREGAEDKPQQAKVATGMEWLANNAPTRGEVTVRDLRRLACDLTDYGRELVQHAADMIEVMGKSALPPTAPQVPRDDEIRLAMGELTADQMRTAKAAIRWVLSRQRT